MSEDMISELLRVAPPSNSSNNAGLLYPMMADYLNIKFTDSSVSHVIFENRTTERVRQYPRLKIQALLKIDGQWKEPEDWTGMPLVSFCRDKKDERIEELVVVYSNSAPGTDVTMDDPATVPLFIEFGVPSDEVPLPKLRLSNVGCYRWRGTSRVTETTTDGVVTETTATVLFERHRDPASPPIPGGVEIFKPVSGMATIHRSGVNEAGCTETMSLTSTAIGFDDGEIEIVLNDVEDPLNRRALGSAETPIPNVTFIVTCPFAEEPFTAVVTVSSSWLILPLPEGAALSDDGRSLVGSSVIPPLVVQWSFTAERERD
jgi:hypothetical protein